MKTVPLFCMIFFLFCSCQPKVEKKPALRINIIDDVQSLDPRKARDLNSIAVMKMLYEGLTRFSKDGTADLALAEKVKISKDKKTYTFFLKKSYWFNNKEVTSYDFASSWKQTLSPSFPAIMSYQLFVIKNAKKAKDGLLPLDDIKIKTPDPYILIVELEKPIPYFLELLSMPIFFPVCKELEEKNIPWEENETLYVGNGPFKIKSWKRQNQIELVKNDFYWDFSAVKLKELFLFMVSEETEFNMFETDKLDWAGSPFSTIPLDAFSKIKNSSSFYMQPFLGTAFLRVNVEELEKNFATKEEALSFRKALASAINRPELIEHVLQGSQISAFSLLPPSLQRTSSAPFQKKLKKHVPLFKTPPPLKLTYRNSKRNYLIAQTIQRNWEDLLQIKIELEPLESKVFFDRLYSKKYQIAMGSWIADFNDAINFLEVFKFKNNGTNNTSWENKDYIDLLNAASICIEKNKRLQMIEQAHSLLMKELPIIPIYHLNICYLKNKKLKDVVLTSLGHADFKCAYIEE